MEPRPSRLPGPWTLAALAVFALLAVCVFAGAGRDDTHITYWPARTLAESGRVLNYSGEAVEQSSSLATVVVLAALRAISGAPLAWLGWLLGVASGALTLLLCGRLAARSQSPTARLAPLALALAHPFAYWASSGMETGLQALLLLGWALEVARAPARPLRLALWSLALCAVRPEASLVALCVAGALALRPARGVPRLAALLSVLGAGAALAAVRLLAFGDWLPQPVRAKAGRPVLAALGEGVSYVAAEPLAGALVVFAALSGLARWLRARGTEGGVLTVAGLCAAAQLGFVLLAGGDWMEGARFLAPALPLAVVLVLARVRAPLAGAVLLAGLGVASALFAGTTSRSLLLGEEPARAYEDPPEELSVIERRNLVHLRDAPLLRALEETLAALQDDARPTILTGQGGMVLFHVAARRASGLRVIDRYGLMDRSLTSAPTAAAAGPGRLGLDLGWERLLREWDAIRAEAELPEPDVVFGIGIGSAAAELLRARGYERVYEQDGEVVAGARRQPARQSIWLARAHVTRLPAGRLESFRFTTSGGE